MGAELTDEEAEAGSEAYRSLRELANRELRAELRRLAAAPDELLPMRLAAAEAEDDGNFEALSADAGA